MFFKSVKSQGILVWVREKFKKSGVLKQNGYGCLMNQRTAIRGFGKQVWKMVKQFREFGN